MTDISFIAFPAIVGVIYLIGAFLKAIGNETLDKFIPVICGFFGGVLGIIVYKTIPGYLPADNWLIALYIGIGSGLCSVGVNQIYKQFTKVDGSEYVSPDEAPIEEGEGEFELDETPENTEGK